MASGKYRLIAWLLAWTHLTLSSAGEGLHNLPGMGHALQCGRVSVWIGSESSSGRASSALSVRCSACPCSRPHGFPENQKPSAEQISNAPIQPDGCCPICSFLAMGKWFAATQEQVWWDCPVAIATTRRMERPDTKAHWGVLARGPPQQSA